MVEYYFEAPSTFINTIIGHSLRKVSFTKCTKKQTNKKKTCLVVFTKWQTAPLLHFRESCYKIWDTLYESKWQIYLSKSLLRGNSFNFQTNTEEVISSIIRCKQQLTETEAITAMLEQAQKVPCTAETNYTLQRTFPSRLSYLIINWYSFKFIHQCNVMVHSTGKWPTVWSFHNKL